MLMCREHGEPSKDQRSGSKDGSCRWCPLPVRREKKPVEDKAS